MMSMYRYALASVIFAVGVFSATEMAQGQETQEGTVSYTQRYLRTLEAREKATTLPAKPYDEQLLFLANLYETGETQEFFAKCLERIAQIGTLDDLPALESLLNREIYGGPDELWCGARTGVVAIVDDLRDKASETWYSIKWKTPKLDEKAKAQSVLYGLRPDSPVKLEPTVSQAWAKKVDGSVMRAAIYDILKKPDLPYGLSPWYVRGRSAFADLLAEPAFAPDKEEVGRILRAGEFGRSVMLRYLVKHGHGAETVPSLVAALQGDNEQRVYLALDLVSQLADLPLDDRTALVRAVAAQGLQAQKRLTQGQLSIVRIALVRDANCCISKLRVDAVSNDYFPRYAKFRQGFTQKEVEAKVQFPESYAYMMEIEAADKWAEEARKSEQKK